MFIFNATTEKMRVEKKMRCRTVLPIVWRHREYLCVVQAHKSCHTLNCFCNGFVGALGCLLLVPCFFFSCLPPSSLSNSAVSLYISTSWYHPSYSFLIFSTLGCMCNYILRIISSPLSRDISMYFHLMSPRVLCVFHYWVVGHCFF